MATQPDDLDDWQEEQGADVGDADDPGENGDDAGDQEQHERQPEADEEQDEILFGDTPLDRGEEEPEGVRNLRQRLREVERENKELKGGKKAATLRDEPTLEDHGYDEEAWKADWRKWDREKDEADKAETEQEELGRAVSEEVEASTRAFTEQRAALKVPGFDAAADKVAALPPLFVNALNVAAKGKAAALHFYLGTHPDELAKIAALDARKVTDLIKVAALAGAMAEKISVSRKPTTTPVERRPGASGGGGGSSDDKLKRLEAQAAKTNDRTALIAYKRELRERSRA